MRQAVTPYAFYGTEYDFCVTEESWISTMGRRYCRSKAEFIKTNLWLIKHCDNTIYLVTQTIHLGNRLACCEFSKHSQMSVTFPKCKLHVRDGVIVGTSPEKDNRKCNSYIYNCPRLTLFYSQISLAADTTYHSDRERVFHCPNDLKDNVTELLVVRHLQ